MYLIEPGQELTTEKLGTILSSFQTKELPQLKRWKNYYSGKQEILFKKSTDETKQYFKSVTNFCQYITDTYNGYLTGIPVQYSGENFDEVIDILKYNDYVNEDNELLRQALIYGKGYCINYIDESGHQRFKTLESQQCIPVYSNTLTNDLLYVIRFWAEELEGKEAELTYHVEVYGKENKKIYKSWLGFSSFELISEEPNYFKQCPVTVLTLNTDETNIFDSIITLQDGYNDIQSGQVDAHRAFADAYLILKGVTADSETLKKAKEDRCFMLDPDCGAEYLTKDTNDTETINILATFKDNIHKISNCPDFTDEAFMAQSGVAIRYKLIGFENKAANIATQLKKALQRRIELICEILNLTDTERIWKDCQIDIMRNLPTDLSDTVAMVNSLRGLVSDETLLGQIQFVTDVKEELKRLQAEQQANMDIYQNTSFQQEDLDE